MCPLSFSVDTSNGLTAMNGQVHVGSVKDDLPVFVKYKDNTLEILHKATGEATAYSEFMITGQALLVTNNKPVDTKGFTNIRPLDEVKRLALGLLPNGSLQIFFVDATIEKLKNMLCAYGVGIAILVETDRFYFSNPRNGIEYGDKLAVVKLNVSSYQELPHPIIVIDPTPVEISELFGDAAFRVARQMVKYLHANYHGTFFLSRNRDEKPTFDARKQFSNSINADFTYVCDFNTQDGVKRGFELQVTQGVKLKLKQLVGEIQKRFSDIVAQKDIQVRENTTNALKRYSEYDNPVIVAKMGYINNKQDAPWFENIRNITFIAEAQAVALADALELDNRMVVANEMSKRSVKYQVNVGRFKFRFGAEELVSQLRGLGYDAYITKELTDD